MGKYIFLIVLGILLVACSPSGAAIQTAIAETQASIPTVTKIFIPTDTQTPTMIPSPTPDLRVIDVNPYNVLLQKADLPSEGDFYLPGSGWTSPNLNQEVIAARTVEEGRIYLQETGRIYGYWVAYKRGSTTVIIPQEVYNSVVLFNSSAGAQLLLSKYGVCVEESDYVPVGTDINIGDGTNVCISRRMQSSGIYEVWLDIEFVYKNIWVDIEGYGNENEVSLDFLVPLANTMLAKLQEQPLTDFVTFSP